MSSVFSTSSSAFLDIPSQSQFSSSRPVTLIGYGMGARVIFHCLMVLAKDPLNGGKGIVENAVLLGAPVGTHHTEWQAARGVVAGRLVNCYSTQDWFLALMYRCRSWDVHVAGLQPVYLQPKGERGEDNYGKEDSVTEACDDRNGNNDKSASNDSGKESDTLQQDTHTSGALSSPVTGCTRENSRKSTYEGNGNKDTYTATRDGILDGEEKCSAKRGRVFSLHTHHTSSISDVENIDVTHLVKSHVDYCDSLSEILPVVFPLSASQTESSFI